MASAPQLRIDVVDRYGKLFGEHKLDQASSGDTEPQISADIRDYIETEGSFLFHRLDCGMQS